MARRVLGYAKYDMISPTGAEAQLWRVPLGDVVVWIDMIVRPLLRERHRVFLEITRNNDLDIPAELQQSKW